MDNLERTLLSWKAVRLLNKNGIRTAYANCYAFREYFHAGFAPYYLTHCWDPSESRNNADVTFFKQLLEIDEQLGVTQTEQLFACVRETLRIDLIEV